MPVLYQRTNRKVQEEDLDFSELEKSIINTWGPHIEWLFSIGQVAGWTGRNRRAVRRAFTQLIKKQLVREYAGGRNGLG